jgi:hypothetical protein
MSQNMPRSQCLLRYVHVLLLTGWIKLQYVLGEDQCMLYTFVYISLASVVIVTLDSVDPLLMYC